MIVQARQMLTLIQIILEQQKLDSIEEQNGDGEEIFRIKVGIGIA